MPVKRRVGKERSGNVPEAIWRNMLDQPLPEDCTGFTRYGILHDREHARPNLPLRVRDYWDMHRDAVLAEWLRDNPGTRPRCWWDWDAPREPIGTHPGEWIDGKLSLSRKRLGGVGTPAHEVLATGLAYSFGIPCAWVQQWAVELYNGRPLGVEGKPLTRRDGSFYREGDFGGVVPDPRNPPLYESQATYLRRLNLLLPGELRRLTARDFEPEAVT